MARGGYNLFRRDAWRRAKGVNAPRFRVVSVEVSPRWPSSSDAFERAKTTRKLESIGKAKGTGTLVPLSSPEIFQDTNKKNHRNSSRSAFTQPMRELAFLIRTLKSQFLDERVPEQTREKCIYRRIGIQEFVKAAQRQKNAATQDLS